MFKMFTTKNSLNSSKWLTFFYIIYIICINIYEINNTRAINANKVTPIKLIVVIQLCSNGRAIFIQCCLSLGRRELLLCHSQGIINEIDGNVQGLPYVFRVSNQLSRCFRSFPFCLFYFKKHYYSVNDAIPDKVKSFDSLQK